MRISRSVILSALVAGIIASLTWAGAIAATDGWEAARQPGSVLVMRHALAPGSGDPATLRLDDCSTQRNLNDKGRAQARAIGDALRANGVTVDRVVSSQWCRCRETAALVDVGPVDDLPALNSFFRNFGNRGPQTSDTKAFLAALPEGERVLMVTHQVNITALTGKYTASGEMFVLQVKEGGEVEITARILIEP